MSDFESDEERVLARLTPQVNSLAKPQPKVLLSARFEVQRNENLRRVFEEYKGSTDPDSSRALASILADTLRGVIEGSDADIEETARYLADEYQQMGESLLLVSSDTGLPIACIEDKDIWQPDLVPREDGTMAKPQARLNPALSSFLMSWHFEREREKRLAEELATRVLQTQALVEAGGSSNLRTVTRDGRAKFVEHLRAELPGILPGSVQGPAGEFLKFVDFTEPARKLPAFCGFTAIARTRVVLADHKARNFRFDEMARVRATIGVQWVKEIARTLSHLLHAETPCEVQSAVSLNPDPILWVGEVDSIPALRQFTVEGARTFEITSTGVGAHVVLKDFDVKHRLLHDRWEFAATVMYDMWVDTTKMRAVKLTDLPVREFRAEVV